MKKLLIFATILTGMFGVLIPQGVFATGNTAAQHAINGLNATGTNSSKDANGIIKDVVGIMMFILGALAVIMIIYSGIQYVTSVGDSGKIQKAKNTLIYSIVGLIVAIFAYAIVNFVLTRVG